MKISTKLTSLLFLCLITFTAEYAIVQKIFITPSYEELEREFAKTDALRCVNALKNEADHLDRICKDWGFWEDTYQFVSGQRADYEEKNLLLETFLNNKLNILYILDNQGNLVWGKEADLDDEEFLSESEGLLDLLKSNLCSNAMEYHEGILSLADRNLIIAARPILIPGEEVTLETPINGTLFMGIYLTEAFWEQLGQRVQASVKVLPVKEEIPAVRLASVGNDTPIFIHEDDPSSISAYLTLSTLSGEPAFTTEAVFPRKISGFGKKILRTNNAFLMFVGSILLIPLLWLSRKMISIPLNRLTAHLTRIRKTDQLSPVPIKNGDDEISVIGYEFNQMIERLNRDAQRRAQAEEALDIARRQAESANHAKSAFLANMSHEIRTPMTAILGYVELLLDPEIKDGNERKDYLEIIHRNGRNLLELINDILDLSKIEEGKQTLDMQVCDLPAFISELTSTMRVRANQKGISLNVAYLTRIPEYIRTDTGKLRQVLINLLGNAVKFTERGGVQLTASFLTEGPEPIPTLRVDVSDTGIGIDPKKLSEIFDPFIQADASTSRQYGGTGLGLAIVKRTLDLLGGRIEAKSDPGKGSTFSVFLPAGNLKELNMIQPHGEIVRHHDHGPDEHKDLPLKNIRILLAEDGQDNQLLIKTILGKAGADVEIAWDGLEALQKAKKDEYDVILMDMQMPNLDGYQATRRLRESGYRKPILALTANVMHEDGEKCLSAGCDDHLAKPVNRRHLIETIAAYAGRIPESANP